MSIYWTLPYQPQDRLAQALCYGTISLYGTSAVPADFLTDMF